MKHSYTIYKTVQYLDSHAVICPFHYFVWEGFDFFLHDWITEFFPNEPLELTDGIS